MKLLNCINRLTIYAVNLSILISTWFLKAGVFLKFWFILICTVWVKEKDSKFRDYKYSDIGKLLDFYLRLYNFDKALSD